MPDIDDIHGEKFSGSKTDTTFGRSAESQAQIHDSSGADLSLGDPLNIYRLEPIANADDPRWENSPPHGVVVVAARTAGDARIVATSRELDFKDIDAAPAEGVTTEHASAFRDEKLYTVIEIEHGRSDVRRGVLEVVPRVETIKPTQE